MTTVRILAAFFSVGLAVPLGAAAPRPHDPQPAPIPAASTTLGTRVLARADSTDAASPAPSIAPTAAATATPPPGPPPTATQSASARTEFEAWENGKIDLSHYVPEAKAQFTDTAVGQISSQYLHPLGAVKTFAYVRQMTVQAMTVYVYAATCANGSLEELISWNADGKVQFIFFRPPA